MTDRKDKNMLTGKASCSAKAFEGLSEDPFGGAIELDAVDWGAVARSYKILRLRAGDSDTFSRNEKLSEDFYSWVALRGESIEFDIAIRMHFDEAMTAQRFLTNV